MTQTSRSGDLIIEHFEFQVLHQNRPVYEGKTYFGFFTPEALQDQKGLPCGSYLKPKQPGGASLATQPLTPLAPLNPDDATKPDMITPGPVTMPGKALSMIDAIDICDPQGGPHGLGYIRGTKEVDPEEWFFKAHFYQDPVCPGSLGLESFLQLLRYFGICQFTPDQAHYRVVPLAGRRHKWTYRGQIIPQNRQVTVEGAITHLTETPHPSIVADGFLQVDGLVIYSMENMGIAFEPLGT